MAFTVVKPSPPYEDERQDGLWQKGFSHGFNGQPEYRKEIEYASGFKSGQQYRSTITYHGHSHIEDDIAAMTDRAEDIAIEMMLSGETVTIDKVAKAMGYAGGSGISGQRWANDVRKVIWQVKELQRN